MIIRNIYRLAINDRFKYNMSQKRLGGPYLPAGRGYTSVPSAHSYAVAGGGTGQAGVVLVLGIREKETKPRTKFENIFEVFVRRLYWKCSTRSHSEHGSEIFQGR